jgi:hypothetical protein
MAWVRLHDGVMTHPKLVKLVDWKNPFCVWVWGLSYCQMHLTDGRIPIAAVPNAKAESTASVLIASGLWHKCDQDTYQIHDYLDWNDSRELVVRKRTEAKCRVANARDKRSREVRENTTHTDSKNFARSSTLGRVGLIRSKEKDLENGESTDDWTARAGELVQNYYDWFIQERKGARLPQKPALDFAEAVTLVRTWDDARLEKLAKIVLTTNDDWISNTDRSFRIFAMKASWADDKLTQWEAERLAKGAAV